MVNKGLSTSLRPYRELFHRCKINFIFVVNIRAPIGAACLDSCSRARDESPAQLKQRFRRLERDSLKLITNDKAFVRSSAFSAPPRFYPVLSTFRDLHRCHPRMALYLGFKGESNLKDMHRFELAILGFPCEFNL